METLVLATDWVVSLTVVVEIGNGTVVSLEEAIPFPAGKRITGEVVEVLVAEVLVVCDGWVGAVFTSSVLIVGGVANVRDSCGMLAPG